MWSVELKNSAPASEVFRSLCQRAGSFWLDCAFGERASFMSYAPVAQLRIGADGRAYRTDANGASVVDGDPIQALTDFVREAAPFGGGSGAPRTVGFLGYELGPELEPHFAARPSDDDVPRAYLARYDAVLACVPQHEEPDAPCRLHIEAASEAAGQALLSAVTEGTRQPIRTPTHANARLIESPDWPEYQRAVATALDYIAAGDVYQVNLARRFQVESSAPAADAYLALRAAQPVPFGAFLECEGFSVLSNSPERFLRVHGDSIATEPIKGTCRRDPKADVDHTLRAELRADPKERAEHVMIVDLERNDLGRLCERASVHVTSLLRLEPFKTLHHLVSTVEGRLRAGTDLSAILRATFPGGSITGAPKIRASEVIHELEPHGRGLYTGALVWFRAEDDFDSSIAIRTAIARDGTYSYHAGGGIVADSDAQREYDECWLKAHAFLTALLGHGVAAALFEAQARCRSEEEAPPAAPAEASE
ncbi:MAG: anthranilate synthase component I family protein [Candidatus Binatia bacterium]|nr:anthranilate synthase component I family protein [Candidatus Binatia bacterium]